jgi:hypothetical protein
LQQFGNTCGAGKWLTRLPGQAAVFVFFAAATRARTVSADSFHGFLAMILFSITACSAGGAGKDGVNFTV